MLVTQSCPTLCNPVDYSPPGSSVHGILQARILAWGHSHPPSDVYVRCFLCPFYTLIKLCYTKALEWSSLVPGPKAKSSSSEITNLTLFTINYLLGGSSGIFRTSFQLFNLFINWRLPMVGFSTLRKGLSPSLRIPSTTTTIHDVSS